MRNHSRIVIWAVALVAVAAGCDGGGSRPTAGGSGGSASMGGGGAPSGTGGATGVGGAGGAAMGVPLVDWVTDLAVNYAPDTHPPDTVDDKVIIDTEDAQAFDPLLQR